MEAGRQRDGFPVHRENPALQALRYRAYRYARFNAIKIETGTVLISILCRAPDSLFQAHSWMRISWGSIRKIVFVWSMREGPHRPHIPPAEAPSTGTCNIFDKIILGDFQNGHNTL